MNFSFVQITDHHLTKSDSEFVRGFSTRYALRTVLRHVAKNVADQADFIISTGDLVDRASEPVYQSFLEMFAVQNATSQMPGPVFISTEELQAFPLYLLPGNHDDRENFFRRLFPQSKPAPLMNVAFFHKGIQFICLDWGPRPKAAAQPEMLDFLAHSIETGAPSIIMMHHHIVPIGSRWLDAFIADDAARFWETIAGHTNILGVFSGHVHTTYESAVNGVPVFGLRSTSYPFVLQDEPLACLLPPQYRLVTVQDGELTTRIFDVPL
jgi:Icc protein